MNRRINAEALALVQRWEGLRLEAYRCPAGVLTIGYGHTRDVQEGQRITEAEAGRLLREDLARFEAAITRLVRVPLTDGQFGALVSWCFNIGEEAARRSTLIRRLNAREYDAVPVELMRWNKVGRRVVAGLTNRRAAEAGLWARGAQVSSNYVTPSPGGTVGEAAATGTGRAAIGLGTAGALSTVAQHADLISALGYVGPVVSVVLIIVAVVLFVLWRRGRI